jgi:hypothetical protein
MVRNYDGISHNSSLYGRIRHLHSAIITEIIMNKVKHNVRFAPLAAAEM